MIGYRLSSLAKSDLADILDYSTDQWGEDQAYLYLNNLEECFIRLARMPDLGRPCDSIQPGLRRLEEEKHVIYYRHDEHGIFVSRVLHQRMLPVRHVLEGS